MKPLRLFVTISFTKANADDFNQLDDYVAPLCERSKIHGSCSIILFKFKSFDQSNPSRIASNFRHLLSCDTIVDAASPIYWLNRLLLATETTVGLSSSLQLNLVITNFVRTQEIVRYSGSSLCKREFLCEEFFTKVLWYAFWTLRGLSIIHTLVACWIAHKTVHRITDNVINSSLGVQEVLRNILKLNSNNPCYSIK